MINRYLYVYVRILIFCLYVAYVNYNVNYNFLLKSFNEFQFLRNELLTIKCYYSKYFKFFYVHDEKYYYINWINLL